MTHFTGMKHPQVKVYIIGVDIELPVYDSTKLILNGCLKGKKFIDR